MANNKKNAKKYRKQNQRKSFPWLFVALGAGLLLVTAAIFFANRNGADSGGAPVISVDQKNIDYGYVKFGENRQFSLKITNSGDGTLRFSEKPYIEVLEGC
jgi:hypothetical protein